MKPIFNSIVQDYLVTNGQSFFFQLISDGYILDMVSGRFRGPVRYLSRHEKWPFTVNINPEDMIGDGPEVRFGRD